MTDIPIIFSGPMVRALLDGRKTMTRRLAWRSKAIKRGPNRFGKPAEEVIAFHSTASPWRKVTPGDRLWVRESILQSLISTQYPSGECESVWVNEKVEYLADEPAPKKRFIRPETYGSPWMQSRPSIHMPRWASRLTLIVTATKIERLQNISEEDARAEGLIQLPATGRWVWARGAQYAGLAFPTARDCFKGLWTALHGPECWDANPEVVALTFTVHKANIDQIGKAA